MVRDWVGATSRVQFCRALQGSFTVYCNGKEAVKEYGKGSDKFI